jgi:hypothetical protein
MATQSVPKATDVESIFQSLLRMRGNYVVAPETTAVNLRDDVSCWLEAVHGTIDTVLDGLQEEGSQIAANPAMVARTLYGALYLLEMVQGALSASYKLERNGGAHHG